MTTLELFKKHRKGEVSRERFLYEVRRDNNLPWITNLTSYNDAVKILKNKGIIREAYENVATDPAVDRVNPYYLKKGVQKSIADEKELKDDTYINHLNKAAKKLQADPKAFHGDMFGNFDTVEKADSKLQTKPVKANNHVDEDNGMKKVKGQETLKAQSAPTGENKKTTKPEGVTVMKDKGVEGSEKVIKEISSYLKKKLAENSMYHEYHVGMEVETPRGAGIVKEINGGTLTVETKDGKLMDVQMNTAKHYTKIKNEESQLNKKEFLLKIQIHADDAEVAERAINELIKSKKISANSVKKETAKDDSGHDIIIYKVEDEDVGSSIMDKFEYYVVGARHNMKDKWNDSEEAYEDDEETDKLLNTPEKSKEKEKDKYDDEDWFPANVDESFENESTLRGGLKPYHDPTSQLTGTGKPNVTGPMPTDDLEDETDLQPGDRVKVVYGNQFYGMTGTIEDVKGGFVIVNIDEDGEDYSMHSSDVEKIGEEEEDDLYEARDINDPALVSARARIATPQKSLANYLDDKDRDFEILQQIKALKREKFQVMRDMEQEAEPEGGPIADDYADRLMDLEQQIKSLEAKLSLNEDDIEEVSYAGKGSITAFKKDPKYSALSGPTRVDMEKKLNAGGSVEL